jgi:Fe-S-cluster-containing hydrogenase component 2/CRP-like cAMP-binding protein
MKELMKGRQKATPTKPPAQLEKREGDWEVPAQLFLACKVFRELGTKPSTEKFPGTLRLRTYEAGQEICWQGDSGWTAFVVLSDEDVRAMYEERDKLIASLPDKIKKIEEEQKKVKADDVEKLKKVAEDLEKSKRLLNELPGAVLPPTGVAPAANEEAASVYLDSTRETVAKPSIFSWWFAPTPAPKAEPKFIATDTAATLDYGTRKARLKPGAIFGQWSCIYGAPRAATILADRRCFVLEMLRNVLDSILRDKKFQEASDNEYVASILQNHLAGLPLFRELSEAELAKVRNEVMAPGGPEDERIQLKRYRDGQLVFDAGDQPDGIYIVRRGVVKVLINAWPLLTADDILDAVQLRKALEAPGKAPVEVSLSGKDDTAALVETLNGLIKNRSLTGVSFKAGKRSLRPELLSLSENPAFRAVWEAAFPEDPADWVDQEWRRFNRLVLEVLYPRLVRRAADKADPEEYRRLGTEQVRTYLMQGDYFGEVGVLRGVPRTATCVAYVHPRPAADDEDDAACARWRREEERVELVLLPKKLIVRLCQTNPKIGAQLVEKTKQILEVDRKAPGRLADEHAGRVFQSPEFQRQGLIQGQKLMLIDLERCTRCDECVNACIDSHNDGRTRLFLDGYRFGKYLVPATCRACRDPVCLIGCPVGSIRRGNNLEIVIENWCIGCQLCATNCPYGSIQMHDLGLVPERAHGWRFLSLSKLSGDWMRPEFSDAGWNRGATPFWWAADLRAVVGEGPVAFRHDFILPADAVTRPHCGLKLVIDSKAAEVDVTGTGRSAKVVGFLPVWINGTLVPPDQWKVQGTQYVFELAEDARGKWFRSGRNVIAVRATPKGPAREMLLQLALDRVEESGAVIAERAVVCDQCSTLPDKVAACVHACPHDAAMRVDAWTNFPVK